MNASDISSKEDYLSYVVTRGEGVIDLISDEPESADIHDAIFEVVDRSDALMGRNNQLTVLLYSPNDDAYERDFGDDLTGTTVSETIAAMAATALREDVQEWAWDLYGDLSEIVPRLTASEKLRELDLPSEHDAAIEEIAIDVSHGADGHECMEAFEDLFRQVEQEGHDEAVAALNNIRTYFDWFT